MSARQALGVPALFLLAWVLAVLITLPPDNRVADAMVPEASE